MVIAFTDYIQNKLDLSVEYREKAEDAVTADCGIYLRGILFGG